MAISTYDGLIAAIATGQTLNLNKASIATQGTAGFTSLWLAAGIPLAGTIPTATGTICTSALTGALAFVNGGSLTTYLARVNWCPATTHNLFLFDRLSHLGGLNGTLTGVQAASLTIPTGRLASADGSNVQWWVETYADVGTTATTLTVTYNDENDVQQTCTVAYGGASPLNQDARLFRILPTASRYIKSIVSVRLTATTGTAGNFGVTCARRITSFPLGTVNVGILLDFAQLGMPVIPDDACLWFAAQLSTTSTGAQEADLQLIQG